MKVSEILVERHEEDDPQFEFIENGAKVRFKEDGPSSEVFTVSQCDPEKRKCWVGDHQGRGWYARFSQLMPVEVSEALRRDSLNLDDFEQKMLNGMRDIWQAIAHDLPGVDEYNFDADDVLDHVLHSGAWEMYSEHSRGNKISQEDVERFMKLPRDRRREIAQAVL